MKIRIPALVAAAALLGSVLAGAAAVPASAATQPVAVVAEAATGPEVPITDEPWSAPAFPADCVVPPGGERVSCEPHDASQIREEVCYSVVVLRNGTVATVCTTAEPNRVLIAEASEGGELKLEYGCNFGDVVCVSIEQASRAMSSFITQGLSWAMGNASFNTDGYLWDVAVSEWSWWQGAVLGVVLIAGVISLTMAAYSRDRSEVTTALIRFVLTVPLSMASIWALGNLTNIVDELTQALITRNDGESLYATVQNMIYNPAKGNFFFAILVLSLFAAAAFVLVLVFSVRNFALASLIALGPVAFMLFPARFGVQWVVRWVSAVFALLLTTPLTLGVMMLVMQGFGSVETLWSIQALPLGAGLLMLVFAPFAVFGLFSFVGGAVAGSVAENAASNLGSRAAGGAQRMGGRAAQLVTRTGASRSAQVRETMQRSRQAAAASGGGSAARGGTSGGGGASSGMGAAVRPNAPKSSPPAAGGARPASGGGQQAPRPATSGQAARPAAPQPRQASAGQETAGRTAPSSPPSQASRQQPASQAAAPQPRPASTSGPGAVPPAQQRPPVQGPAPRPPQTPPPAAR